MKGGKLKYTNRSVVNSSMEAVHIALPANRIVAKAYREFVDRSSTRRRVFPLTMINFSPIFERDTARPGDSVTRPRGKGA